MKEKMLSEMLVDLANSRAKAHQPLVKRKNELNQQLQNKLISGEISLDEYLCKTKEIKQAFERAKADIDEFADKMEEDLIKRMREI